MDEQYAIWWVNTADEIAIGHDIEIECPDMPEYIVTEYHSRCGRNGRGRLWCAPGIPVEGIEWRENSLAARYAEGHERHNSAGGIVIRLEDMPHVRKLPGIITDLEMTLI